MNNDETLVFDNLYKLQKWEAELLNCAYKSLKQYSTETLGYLTK